MFGRAAAAVFFMVLMFGRAPAFGAAVVAAALSFLKRPKTMLVVLPAEHHKGEKEERDYKLVIWIQKPYGIMADLYKIKPVSTTCTHKSQGLDYFGFLVHGSGAQSKRRGFSYLLLGVEERPWILEKKRNSKGAKEMEKIESLAMLFIL